MLPATTRRVPMSTPSSANAQIRRQTEINIDRYASANPQAINRRLAELDAEWDTERFLETMAPSITMLGITLGLTVNRKWFALPFLVQAFFLQHALQGWCPPLPLLRHLGVRTAAENCRGTLCAQALRGDFQRLAGENPSTSSVMESVRS